MQPILNGAGNLDEMNFATRGFRGAAVRLFDAKLKQWSIYWANENDGALLPPVLGRFESGRGEFYGDDFHDGRAVRVRYIWLNVTPSSAHWEQAFSVDQGRTWETNWTMEFSRRCAAQDCSIVELRQYDTKPERRDDLIGIFEEHFIDGQELYGMNVIGQFRDFNNPDKFVWLRGFKGMEERRRALDGFYSGPIWWAHRDAANDTMVDWNNVLLLKPYGSGAIAAPTQKGNEDGVIAITIFYPNGGQESRFGEFFENSVAPEMRSAGAEIRGYYETAAVENTYPRLPVREGEYVFVSILSFRAPEAYCEYESRRKASASWQAVEREAQKRAVKQPDVLSLAPTRLSRLR